MLAIHLATSVIVMNFSLVNCVFLIDFVETQSMHMLYIASYVATSSLVDS